MDVVLLKWGGSLITDKATADSVRSDQLARLAAELAAARPTMDASLVLGHGGGSFGHAAAERFGLNRGPLDERGWQGAGWTQARARALHAHVVDALLAAGERPFSIAPSSLMTGDSGGAGEGSFEIVAEMLDGPLLPVVHGDVVLDRAWGASIASTERVFGALERSLSRAGHRVVRAIWLGETDGVWDGDGKTIDLLERRHLDEAALGASRGSDVTGGMRHRVEHALRLAERGIESWILDGRRSGTLAAALGGERIGGSRVAPAR